MGDNWIPEGNTGNKDQDWQDFYHSEFRGFNQVYMTSPSGDLTVSTYASTEGWFTFQGNSGNYTSGNLYEEDVYSGNSTSGPLLRKTVNTYAGNSGTKETCNGNYSGVYTPCEIMLLRSRVTQYEGSNNSNPPWVQHDYTYDDYSSSTGLIFGYHNTLQEVISSSNAPTLTKKWTYAVTDKSVNNWVYYDVHKVAHSEVDDSTGHVWQCQDTSYDEGTSAGATPAAGWPTTTKTYSDCSNPGGTAITSYTGYDTNANVVASVDGVGAANKSLYGSSGTSGKNGCTLSTAPPCHESCLGCG